MKYNKIYLLFVLPLLLWSCEDAINVDPADEIVESNAITNVDEVGQAVIGVYANLTLTSPIYWDALFTDELTIAPGNNGQGIQTHTWSITTGNGEAAGIYASFSTIINRANRILEAIEGISPENAEEEALLSRYKGELLAIRAWAHFTMATYFTPSLTDMDALSVPYVDYVVTLETPNRNTLGELLEGVRNDLDEAEALLPDSFDAVYFFNANAITALRSRIALYTENYDAAIQYSTELINKYSLPSIEDYPLVWTDETIEGQIFQLARVTGGSAIGSLFNPTLESTYFNPSEKLLAAYIEDDVRLDVFFEGDRIWKYPGVTGDIGLNDIKVFRVSEQYLIRAEAYLRKSSPNVEAAEEDFNTLRRNRIVDYVDIPFTTAAASLELVMEERFRELAYEGHRFIDLKRTGSPVDRWEEDCEDLAAENACFLPATSHLWALPIPQSEIFVNDDMVQNPEYN